jgi:predicted Zn-dependent protease
MGWGRGFRSVAFCLAAAMATAAAPMRDPRIQERLYTHLDRASDALEGGRFAEARTTAEMILLASQVRVRLDLAQAPLDQVPTARSAFESAVRDWEIALDGEVDFVDAAGGPADVTVAYKGHVVDGGTHVAGLAEWRRKVLHWSGDDYSYQVLATIQVRTLNPNGRRLEEAAVKATTMHEIGHVLGLDDSPRVGDVMGPLDPRRPSSGPSAAELQSLRTLRAQAHGYLQEAVLHMAYARVPR